MKSYWIEMRPLARKLIRYAPFALSLAALAVSIGAFSILDKRHPAAVTYALLAMAAVVCVLLSCWWMDRGMK